jgi:hypothetical protein
MKYAFRLLTAWLMFVFCCETVAQVSLLRTPATLHPLPLVYTGRWPDVYLPGDSLVRKYIATHMLDVAADVSFETNWLINRLKERGKAEGVDAIILRDMGQRVMGPEGGVATITGVGIKYLETIDYLQYIIRQRVFNTFDTDGNPGASVVVNYDWRGNFTDAFDAGGRRYFADSILPFDLHLAMIAKPDMYRYTYSMDNILSMIKLNAGYFPEKNIQYWPEPANTAGDFILRVADEGKGVEKYKIQRVVNQGQYTGAIITKGKKPFMYLYFQFDQQGRIAKERWEKLIDGKRRIWIQVENRFHENEPDAWPVRLK